MREKIGVVDVGGGFRGVYAAGVLDYCMDEGIHFDLGIGVSAGSTNLASYAAGQCRRNLKFYTEYGLRKEYASIGNFIRHRSFLNLDYGFGTLSNSDGEYPLDYQAIIDNPMEFYVVTTDARTGKAVYFDKHDLHQDDYSILKASSSIPLICTPYPIGDALYFDGALGDPVPVAKAFALGCDRVVVILTKPEDLVRVPGNDLRLARGIQKHYPESAQQLRLRAEHYNQGVALARQYAAQGRALIVSPDDTCGVSTLTRDADALNRLYAKGYADGSRIAGFLAGFSA